jgi:ATP-dependent exoDNAse (exonuclease V) beta subunit
MKIHYSQLNEFVSCPMSYKRRYIDKTPDDEKSSALEYGTAIHLAIKTHFEGGDSLEVFKLFWDSLKDTEMKYWRHSWSDLRNLALNQFLPNFFRLHSKKYKNVKMEELCEAPLEDYIIEGTFDCVADYDGVLTLSDWKTSSKEYKKDKIIKNPQMYMYAEMYRHKYGELPKQIQYKVFRKDNGGIQTLTAELTEEKLKLQLKEVSSIIKTVEHMTKTGNWYHNFDCFCKE